MEQLSLEGMPRRLYACTPTRLSTWLDCPRRYRMTYLDRPAPAKGPPWAHNSLGASVHNALAGWWRLRRRDRTVAAVGDLLDQGWLSDGFADPGQSLAYRQRCRQLVERYVAGLDPAVEPVGVERTVATRSELIAVSGRIDRLDDRRAGRDRQNGQPSGDLVVVDYKTGRHKPTVDDARSSLALALYALAAGRVLRRPCRRVELHHVPTGSVAAWEHTPESLDRQLRRAEQIAAECADADQRYLAVGAGGCPPLRASLPGGSAVDTSASGGSAIDTSAPGSSTPGASLANGSAPGSSAPGPSLADGPAPGSSAPGASLADGSAANDVFPPRPGPGCGWCDFRALCPEGRAASPHRRPWDGLDPAGEGDQPDVLAPVACSR